MDPPSVKGKIRQEVLERLWAANRSGKCQISVARAADFYGPGINNSLIGELIFKKVISGERPQWLGAPDLPHSFTYTPDAGRHFALLANDARAWGESWHLPTAAAPWTPRQWAQRAAEALAERNDSRAAAVGKLLVLPKPLFWAMSRFMRVLYEAWDVQHQGQVPYVFDSTKFEQTFGITPTPYAEGLVQALNGYRHSTCREPTSDKFTAGVEAA